MVTHRVTIVAVTSTSRTAAVTKSVARLADGRELIYSNPVRLERSARGHPQLPSPVRRPARRVGRDRRTSTEPYVPSTRQRLSVVPVQRGQSERDTLTHIRCRRLRESLSHVRRDR